MDVSAALGAATKPVSMATPKVHHITGWTHFLDPKRMEIIANIAKMRGRDPRIATLAVSILKQAGAQPRQYRKQAAALLSWVQHNLYYVNEPGERLQDPLYTLKVGYGDCDDLIITLASLLESIRMPWKLVISGTTKSGKKIRYHQGEKFPTTKGINWSHIYMAIGDRPFTPNKWEYAEATVRGAPLGWDVVDGSASQLPEMQSYGATMPTIANKSPSMSLSKRTMAPISTGFQPSTPSATPSFTMRAITDVAPGLSTTTTAYDTFTPVADAFKPSPGILVPSAGPVKANSVAILVRDPTGGVMLLHRSADQPWKPSQWDLPGGKISSYNAARPQAAKLLLKESGVSVSPARLHLLNKSYHPSAGTSAFFTVLLSASEAEAAGQFNVPEHQAYQWVSPIEVKSLDVVPYVHFVLRAARGENLDPNLQLSDTPEPTADTLMTSTVSVTPTLDSSLNLLGGYGAMQEIKDLASRKVLGVPVWLIGAGAALYLYRRK